MHTRFTLDIDLSNAAFVAPELHMELAETLRNAAEAVWDGRWSEGDGFPIVDANGNTVGRARFEGDEEEAPAPNATDIAPTPMVHLNGSGRDRLVEQKRTIATELNLALEALRTAYPHMRDYYPLEDGEAKYLAARQIADQRMEALQEILNAVTAETLELLNHGDL